MGSKGKKIIAVFMAAVMLFTFTGGSKADAAGAADKVKNACAAALKAAGNKNKVKYTSAKAEEFDGISYKCEKKVEAVFIVMSENAAYSICVAQSKTVKDAKALYKSFADYKKSRINNDYFKTDYTKEEQSVMKNAIYGRKGKFTWYISMSSKNKNIAGQTALKKKL